MPTPSAEELSPRAAIKRHLIRMIVAIVILDAIAIPVRLLYFNDAGQRQTTYVGIWTLLSAVIVAIQLRKIRRARLAAIRGSGPPTTRG